MDQAYLKNQGYPMMKEISEFWEDHLKSLGKGGEGFASDDKDANLDELKDLPAGTLVAPHGWSPEHGPREDGVSHDQQLIWDLFSNTITASDYLRESKGFSSDLLKKRDLLAKPKIGKEGNLQEWMIDRQGAPNHRHTSHLYAVYPGNQISMEKTPELAKAAKKALEDRGSTGDSRRSWTWPWRTALWARFKEGNRAHDMIAGLIHHNLLDNMLATHPPMQMDGTYGITGAMCEMLLQSHTGDFTKQPEISLLPAPTEDWPSGKVKGLKARGNITVDFQWEDGKVTKYRLTAPTKTQVKLTVNGETKTVTTSQPKDPSKKNKKQGANKPA
jgi:alpha-L-fucosidase 2